MKFATTNCYNIYKTNVPKTEFAGISEGNKLI